ncbi:MAG: uridine diphosphate-N-acetylglucosamine-binding protein YvcK [Actinomycetota bacterium]
MKSNFKAVAFGGGHGLAASLQALKILTNSLTAIVGVSDNGGSSGRLRAEFDVIPPGDLRMALVALCSDSEHGEKWARVLQHRFSGDGQLAGHALGNLLITALWQENNDIVAGLDAVCNLLEAQGRVLPLSLQPLDIVADVLQENGQTGTVYGQVAVATSKGKIQNLRFEKQAATCPQALEAITDADVVVMGPGSWYTSVVNHLLLPDLNNALQNCKAKKILITNLCNQTEETKSFTPAKHIDVLKSMSPNIYFDAVIVDQRNVSYEFFVACKQLSDEVLVANVADNENPDIHDSAQLADALRGYLELPNNNSSNNKEG